MTNIAENIQQLRHRLQQSCAAADRPSETVQIIAAAKTFNAAAVRQALAADITNIGENYLQEGAAKIAALGDTPAVWHFIGHIQRNKAREVARLFDWLHTVDKLSLAQRLSTAREGMPPLNILLQINIDDDAAKSGAPPAAAITLAQAVAALPNLRLRGLMAMPRERTTDKGAPFRALASLQAEVAAVGGLRLDALSMGMSGDFTEAIAAGATHIRLGTAIFGARPKKA